MLFWFHLLSLSPVITITLTYVWMSPAAQYQFWFYSANIRIYFPLITVTFCRMWKNFNLLLIICQSRIRPYGKFRPHHIFLGLSTPLLPMGLYSIACTGILWADLHNKWSFQSCLCWIICSVKRCTPQYFPYFLISYSFFSLHFNFIQFYSSPFTDLRNWCFKLC